MYRYILRCLNCGKTFEAFLNNRSERIPCPNCNSKAVRKKYSTQDSKSIGCG